MTTPPVTTPTTTTQPTTNGPLARSRNKLIGGVVAGLAEHYRVDTTLARLLAVLVFVCSAGTAIVAYAVAWVMMPGPDHQPAPINRWQRTPPPSSPSSPA